VEEMVSSIINKVNKKLFWNKVTPTTVHVSRLKSHDSWGWLLTADTAGIREFKLNTG